MESIAELVAELEHPGVDLFEAVAKLQPTPTLGVGMDAIGLEAVALVRVQFGAGVALLAALAEGVEAVEVLGAR